MNGLNEINQMNNAPQGLAPGKRRCSIHINHNQGGDITSAILHSASHRDTKFVDWKEEFQRGFFLATLKLKGVTLEEVVAESQDTEVLDAIDEAVESYWGYGEQPDQTTIPGYDEAEWES